MSKLSSTAASHWHALEHKNPHSIGFNLLLSDRVKRESQDLLDKGQMEQKATEDRWDSLLQGLCL